MHCDLKINFDNFNLNYSLDITTTNLLFYENSKKELLNIHNMFFPNSKTNEKIFINSLESWITIAEKIISVHKILNDKKDDLEKRDVRHFYDIYSWYKNNKNSENILKIINIYKQIIESRKSDKKYFKKNKHFRK